MPSAVHIEHHDNARTIDSSRLEKSPLRRSIPILYDLGLYPVETLDRRRFLISIQPASVFGTILLYVSVLDELVLIDQLVEFAIRYEVVILPVDFVD